MALGVAQVEGEIERGPSWTNMGRTERCANQATFGVSVAASALSLS